MVDLWHDDRGERKQAMAHDTQVNGEVNSQTGLKSIFRELRRDIEQVDTRSELRRPWKTTSLFGIRRVYADAG
jgi:hypothetical protein